jgi:hypothetical protein
MNHAPRPPASIAPWPLALLVLLAGCPSTPEVPPPRVTLGPAVVRFSLGQRASAGRTAPAAGLLAVGLPSGAIVLARPSSPPPAPPLERLELDAAGHPVHEGPVVALAFSESGRRLLSIGGRTAAFWDVEARRLIRHVRGPQLLTAGELEPDGTVAYFATEQGHVLRWRTTLRGADSVRGFACSAFSVDPVRRGLPEARRCPYGTYVEPREGPAHAFCTYPVTVLELVGRTLLRSCREGNTAILDLATQKTSWHMTGHVVASVPVAPGKLEEAVFATGDGELKVYSFAGSNVVRTLGTRGAVAAAGGAAGLVVFAQGGELRVFSPAHEAPVATRRLPARAVWLDLVPAPSAAGKGALVLELLLEDGRFLTYPVAVAPAATATAR